MLQLGLIGHPLSHSLSPRLQNAALRAMEIPGEYMLYPIEDLRTNQPELSRILEKLRRSELNGLNITIPYKTAIISFIDQMAPTAAAVDAVNTLFNNDGLLVGDNTDVAGFLMDLGQQASLFFHENLEKPNSRKQAIVLGAGGSARAVCYALLKSGWQLTIAARDRRRVQVLTNQLTAAIANVSSSVLPDREILKLISVTSMEMAGLKGVKASLVVNTTPVGMFPEIDFSPWPENLPLPSGAFIYDLVYNPPETRLVREARNLGHPVANGIGMLIEQAALSLEIWSGQSVPRQSMWQAVPDFNMASRNNIIRENR